MVNSHKIILGNSQKMPEIHDSSVQLMLTSPPYPMVKMWDDHFGQINPAVEKLWKKLKITEDEKIVISIFEQMHESLAKVWKEVFRVLIDGGIACINIGDATRTINGKFRVFANHSKIIDHCEKLGFITLPYILWKKPTTKPQYKGKGAFLGSGFLPPNAYVTLDCEFILIFRKGKLRRFPTHDKTRYDSALTKNQRDKWFTQIWAITGARQKKTKINRRIAAFPDEIANRIISMFSIKNDIVLDPFLGSGTTTKIAMINQRNSIGYEIDKNLIPLIKDRIGNPPKTCTLEFIQRRT